ncbi:MAG: membrane protein insertion efficiency factor YidD [bacterium]|nr:membrane protein insertion efficiency factor YidD [bacterium]
MTKMLLEIIRVYQIFIGPGFGKNCRFYPSCSNYAAKAIEKYGAGTGVWKGLRRILKCHPFNQGGVDLP